jgi:hypothetical protein
MNFVTGRSTEDPLKTSKWVISRLLAKFGGKYGEGHAVACVDIDCYGVLVMSSEL